MRHIAIDQKSIEKPQPAAAKVQTDNPTPISLKGLWLKRKQHNKVTLKYLEIGATPTKMNECKVD